MSSANPDLAAEVLTVVLEHQRQAPGDLGCAERPCRVCLGTHLEQVERFIAAGEPVEFVLPAFPAKSPNPAKVLGHLPDLAEVAALTFLQSLCDRIARIYEPGARLVICSDGRVFGDLIEVPDAHISDYKAALTELIVNLGADGLTQFDLDDVHPGVPHDEMRRVLVERYAEPLEVLRAEVKAGGPELALYRGITRFMFEDRFGPTWTGSRAALQREARARAYGVIQRSRAWADLVSEHYPDSVRLSIHPHRCGAEKIGVHLLETEDSWLTPWHAVAIEERGRLRLVKRAEAEASGAELVYVDGRPSHYRASARFSRCA
jgi:pyoverdine/dityrosine biosynthesis protein Dit1